MRILCLTIIIQQVFKISYCEYFDPTKLSEVQSTCEKFVSDFRKYDRKLLDKQKIHLLLHLPQNMAQFGPTASFNTEHYNGIVREYNLHGNRKACSRDIVSRFGRVETLQMLSQCKETDIDRYSFTNKINLLQKVN